MFIAMSNYQLFIELTHLNQINVTVGYTIHYQSNTQQEPLLAFCLAPSIACCQIQHMPSFIPASIHICSTCAHKHTRWHDIDLQMRWILVCVCVYMSVMVLELRGLRVYNRVLSSVPIIINSPSHLWSIAMLYKYTHTNVFLCACVCVHGFVWLYCQFKNNYNYSRTFQQVLKTSS